MIYNIYDIILLSPFLFRFYVRNIISIITGLGYGCNVGGTMVHLSICWCIAVLMQESTVESNVDLSEYLHVFRKW